MKQLFLTTLALTFVACQKPNPEQAGPQADAAASSKGVGPVKSVEIGAFNAGLATKGEKLFHEKCSACHHVEDRYIGPAVKGVTTRRTPEWVMNMIVNPTEMTQQDATAKELLGEYMTQMTNQNVNEDDARTIYEYFRKIDGGK